MERYRDIFKRIIEDLKKANINPYAVKELEKILNYLIRTEDENDKMRKDRRK